MPRRPAGRVRRHLLLVLLGVALLGLLLPAAGVRAQNDWRDPARLAALGAQLDATLTEGEVTGAALALVDRDGFAWTHSFGVADRATGRPVDADTPFRVGSISKSFTALAVMQLVEAGRLELNAPLAQLAPEVPFVNPWEATHPVRLVHLLEHSAGFDDVPYADYRSGAQNEPVAEYARTARPEAHWQPGERFRYANPGPAIAGYLVERASGRPFDEYVEAELLRPLGMPNASFRTTPELLTVLARSYQPGRAEPEPYWHMRIRPTGAMHVSAREMANFVVFLARRGVSASGERLISDATALRMERPASTAGARAGLTTGFGLGRFGFVEGGRLFLGHWGSVDGFLASYGYLPESGRGFVLLINTANGEARARAHAQIAAHLAADLPAPAPVASGSIDPSAAGFYRSLSPDRQMVALPLRFVDVPTLRVDTGVVTLAGGAGGEERLVPIGGGLLQPATSDAPTAVLVQTAAGWQLHTAGGSYAQVSGLWVWASRGLLGATVGLTLVSLFYGIAALFRARRFTRGALLLRLAPLLAGLATLAVPALVIPTCFLANDAAALDRCGTPGLWAWAVFGLSWLAPLVALGGLVLALRAPSSGNRFARWLCGSSCLVVLLFCAYMARYGWIGLRTWAD